MTWAYHGRPMHCSIAMYLHDTRRNRCTPLIANSFQCSRCGHTLSMNTDKSGRLAWLQVKTIH